MCVLFIKAKHHFSCFRKPYFFLLLYLVSLGFNLNKPFHNDDTFHLESAKLIEENPLKPMSGEINWNEAHRLFNSNHPPGYYYLLSFMGSRFGYDEWVLHLFQSLFSFLVIVFFFKIAQRVNSGYEYFSTAFMVLNPALIPNQNLSIDIPILAMHLGLFYFLLKDSSFIFKRVFIMGCLLSISILMKYTSIALIPVFLILGVGNRKLWLVLVLPFITLVFWSFWNIYEFGFVHIFSREVHSLSFYVVVYQTAAFILALGSLGPLSLLFFSRKGSFSFYIKAINITSGLLLVGIVIGQMGGFLSASISTWLLWGVFMVNGLMVVGMLIYNVALKKKLIQILNNRIEFILWLWLLAFASFVILFSPFMATRHVLLALPPILLLLVYYLKEISFRIKLITLSFLSILTVMLSVSDWKFADFFRQEARIISDKYLHESNVYFTGQMGWQWYAKKKGMQKYNADSDTIFCGDLFVIPSKVSAEQLPDIKKFIRVEERLEKTNWLKMISTSGYYRSNARVLPWNIDLQNADCIKIYRCTDVVFPIVSLNN